MPHCEGGSLVHDVFPSLVLWFLCATNSYPLAAVHCLSKQYASVGKPSSDAG